MPMMKTGSDEPYPLSLLRPRRARPHRRTSDQADKIAPPHHGPPLRCVLICSSKIALATELGDGPAGEDLLHLLRAESGPTAT